MIVKELISILEKFDQSKDIVILENLGMLGEDRISKIAGVFCGGDYGYRICIQAKDIETQIYGWKDGKFIMLENYDE